MWKIVEHHYSNIKMITAIICTSFSLIFLFHIWEGRGGILHLDRNNILGTVIATSVILYCKHKARVFCFVFLLFFK